MAFTAKDVQNLRAATGCGMMDCKKALTEANGDVEKATEILREKGLAAATKKAGRIAAEGTVYAYTDEAKKVGVLIEVNAETDFVAKNDEFMKFVKVCAEIVAEQNPADVDALLKVEKDGQTVEAMLQDKILTIGENIKVRRFVRMEGVVSSYIHGGGRIGVMVQFDTSDDVAAKDEFKAYGKDVAMQVAAMNAEYVDSKAVPAEIVDKEKEILTAQAVAEGKPEAIAQKMVMGRINKFFKEVCLVDQAFIKDDSINIATYTKNTAAALGGEIAIKGFVRFEKGEGLEKREDNFADEVASMVK